VPTQDHRRTDPKSSCPLPQPNARLARSTAACDILHLDIGPIFLDLLGLQVDLSEIVLDITAVPGPGNLLGNLLCSVAGLLDNGLSGTLQGLIDLINNLLG
jgi:hypothetical protein